MCCKKKNKYTKKWCKATKPLKFYIITLSPIEKFRKPHCIDFLFLRPLKEYSLYNFECDFLDFPT